MFRLLPALLCCSCATAKVIGPPLVTTPDPMVPRVVVLEPFFETADWRENVKELREPNLITGRIEATQVRETTKPLLAQVDSLAAEHRAVLQHVQRLRPSWRVTSTSGLAALEGPVTVVRVIIESSQTIESDRSLKNTAFAFGLVIWPLQVYNFWPVTETERVYGTLERFVTDAPTVKQRLVRYPTQPDSAFDAKGFTALRRDIGLDVTYEEGLLASEEPRKGVLIEAFSERLASAIVAIVEEP